MGCSLRCVVVLLSYCIFQTQRYFSWTKCFAHVKLVCHKMSNFVVCVILRCDVISFSVLNCYRVWWLWRWNWKRHIMSVPFWRRKVPYEVGVISVVSTFFFFFSPPYIYIRYGNLTPSLRWKLERLWFEQNNYASREWHITKVWPTGSANEKLLHMEMTNNCACFAAIVMAAKACL